MTIHELNDASSIIYEEAGENANVILGCVVDSKLTDQIHITVIATGLNDDEYPRFIDKDYNTNNTFEHKVEKKDNKKIIKRENEVNKDENNSDDIISFGDELEVPTFLRNKNS